MSITPKHTRTWIQSGLTPLDYEKAVTFGGGVNVSEVIPAGSVDLAVTCAIDVSAMNSLFIGTDQDITIETNNAASGSADDILVVPANQPVDWMENDVHAKPLTVDTTIIYVTNAGDTDANLEIRAGQDATP